MDIDFIQHPKLYEEVTINDVLEYKFCGSECSRDCYARESREQHVCSDRYTNFARSRTGRTGSRILTGSRTEDPVCDLAKYEI